MDIVKVGSKTVDLFKELIWDITLEMWLKKTIAKLAAKKLLKWMAWGPVQGIIIDLVLRFADDLYAHMKEFIVVEAIPLRNKKFQKEYAEASFKLKEAAEIYGIDGERFKEIRNENKKALSDFARTRLVSA